ncbi:MAG: aldehyde dehydrogenase family protein, partial [Boseongicola sp. SB0662_bin_57]|nr:aldehyde dehydrogenase family protein [Boseongicola sp. SB0662_bin_57]
MTERPHFQLYVDGAWTEGSAAQVMESQNPADGKDWATFACAAPEDVDHAVVAARRALEDPAWRDLTQTARGHLLFRLADLVERNAERLARLETADSGKLLAETAAQATYVGSYYRYFAGLADKIEGAVLPIDKPGMHVFTGGPETARHVIRNSAENFAATTLELGGKSPILVFDDADLDSAINGLIAGNFGASGQSCVAGSRGLVQRDILATLVERIAERAGSITIGDPLDPATDVGPLCTRAQIERIETTLAQAVDQGATIHFGGMPLDQPGNYMQPTLVECAGPDISTLEVEMFGPVMSL